MKDKKRILVFSWRDPKHPLAGGAEQVMHEHMKGWVRSGFDVTLFSSKVRDLLGNEDIDGIKIIRKGSQYLGVQLAGFLYYLKNKDQYDLIVDQFHGLPFFTPLYIRKPIIAVIQETAREVWFLNPLIFPINLIVGVLGYVFEPFIFLIYRNTKFITGSNSASEDIQKFGIPKKNITVVPHGVITVPVKEEKNNVFTVTYLGILSKDKGIEDALKCFAYLKDIGDFEFWVIGKPETRAYGKELETLIKKLDLKNIKLWGFVQQKEKFKLLAKSHLLINPSKREGWGLVNIEANSVGTPVIAYPSAGLVDSVKDGVSGMLVADSSPQSLTEAINKLYNDRELYEKMKISSVDWSSNFSWDKSSAKSLKLIEGIL